MNNEIYITLTEIELMKHAIGYSVEILKDKTFVKTVRGVRQYTPFRNYFGVREPNKIWEGLIKKGFAEKILPLNENIHYKVSKEGMRFLSRLLDIRIG